MSAKRLKVARLEMVIFMVCGGLLGGGNLLCVDGFLDIIYRDEAYR